MNYLTSLTLAFYAGFRTATSHSQVITLSNQDFADGTVVISQSDVRIILTEDIVFNPRSDYTNSPNEVGAYTCLPGDANKYPGCDKAAGSFRLGFFSAISLEADDIEFDLNGHSLSTHEQFHLQQRFFALISVGKGPFINGQGPSKFGTDISVKNIEISNGHLGLTPHHGIHGNFMENVEIYDLTIDNFEVAGIQLNGFEDVYIHDCDIGPNLRNVPVRGRYSQARFGLLSYREMGQRLKQLSSEELAQNYSIEFVDRPGESVTAVEIIDRLIKGMNLYFDYKINGNIPKLGTNNYNTYAEAMRIFDNEFGDPDGSAIYGILLHSAGNAANWFGSAISDYSENAIIEDVNIHDLNLRVQEIVGYQESPLNLVTGPFKGALPMDILLNLDEYDPETFDLASDSVNNYHGNLLTDAQIALALFGEGTTELEGNTINEEVIGWALGQNGLSNGNLICNGDDMFHMDKGAIGIRIERIDSVEMLNVDIRNINNWSQLGSKFCNQYDNATHEANGYDTHPTTSTNSNYDNGAISNYKYQGRVSRGISITDVSGDVSLENIAIDGIFSVQGSAIGIDLLGSTEFEVDLQRNIIINDIGACGGVSSHECEYLSSDESFPNNNIIGCSMLSDDNDRKFNHKNSLDLSVTNVEGPYVCQ